MAHSRLPGWPLEPASNGWVERNDHRLRRRSVTESGLQALSGYSFVGGYLRDSKIFETLCHIIRCAI
jgi:hypothetical protein